MKSSYNVVLIQLELFSVSLYICLHVINGFVNWSFDLIFSSLSSVGNGDVRDSCNLVC